MRKYIIALFISLAVYFASMLFLDNMLLTMVNAKLQWANETLQLDWKAERKLYLTCKDHK